MDKIPLDPNATIGLENLSPALFAALVDHLYPQFEQMYESTRSPSLDKLAMALAKAQGEFKPIPRDRTVTIRPKEKAAYTFQYADLANILEAVRPALSKNELALVQFTPKDNQLVTKLIHSSGQFIESSFTIPSWNGELKNLGAAMTYLRRYQVSALLCIASDDDLDEDGQAAGEGGQQSQVKLITGVQVKVLETMCKDSETDPALYCKFMNVADLKSIPADRYVEAEKGLKNKIEKLKRSAQKTAEQPAAE